MKPTRSILSPDCKYVNSSNTDLKKTFARVRREQALAEIPKPANVLPIATSTKRGSP